MYDLYYIYFDGDGPNLGTCVIPNELGGLIQDVCVERERFLDLGRKGYPPIEFYAVEQWDGYVLHYGDPRKAPELPSLGEFVEKRGYDHSDDKSLREYLAEFGGGDQGNDQEIAAAMQSIRVKLNDPITDGELEYWWEWDHAMDESTDALAYCHLMHLTLDDGEPCGEQELGCISFVEGDCPGSNARYVIADSLAAIACLQYCLNELGTGIKINLLL